MARKVRQFFSVADESVEFAPLVVQTEGSFIAEASVERLEAALDKVTVRLDGGSRRGDCFCAECVGIIFLSNGVRIVLATKPVNFRRRHDGLVAHVKGVLRKDPFMGTVFAFRTKRADSPTSYIPFQGCNGRVSLASLSRSPPVCGDEKPRLDGDFSDIGHRGAVAAWFAGGSWLGAAVGK